jgi:hypothetical protein
MGLSAAAACARDDSFMAVIFWTASTTATLQARQKGAPDLPNLCNFIHIPRFRVVKLFEYDNAME